MRISDWSSDVCSSDLIREEFSDMAQHARTDRSASARKDDVIQIRAAAELKAMLSRAASLRGQKLSEFMLASARREAEATILDQRTFFLDAESQDRKSTRLNSSH